MIFSVSYIKKKKKISALTFNQLINKLSIL